MKGIEIKDLKVLKDHRGWFVELFRKEFGIEKMAQVNLTVANPGMAKGNHYHLYKTEWYCVIKGRMKLVLKDMDSGKVSELTLGDDNLRIVKIPPRVIHGFKNTGEGDMYLLYCTDTPFDPQDPDTSTGVVLE
ncbi:MAG: hypothetical protein A3D89_01440 [Planctomycetes bacterium RIFCSPHIGHO2_02_FULL_52_58]|nr:MAG: hypothetical protein A3D89_01440 [Planctomycetes bacterium RIFCSPHIGHO2_02_FULL_52_58]